MSKNTKFSRNRNRKVIENFSFSKKLFFLSDMFGTIYQVMVQISLKRFHFDLIEFFEVKDQKLNGIIRKLSKAFNVLNQNSIRNKSLPGSKEN